MWWPAPARAAAGINQTINFQGRLLTNSGAVVADGNYNMRFKVYQDGNGCVSGGTSPCGGTLKWTETRQNSASAGVVVKNGYFSLALGSVTAFGGSVDWNQDTLWLSMELTTNGTDVSGSPTWNGEMLPFKRLSSAVYALQAQTANTCTGCILQAPSSTAQNTITPTVNSVVGLTVNGTSGTAATAMVVNQTQAADSLQLNVSSASGTATNGILVAKTAAGTLTNGLSITNATGTLVNGIAITQSSGTLSNGLVFGGTIAKDITTASGTNRDLTVSPDGTGKVIIGGSLTVGSAAAVLTADTANKVVKVGTSTSGADLVVGPGFSSHLFSDGLEMGSSVIWNGTTGSPLIDTAQARTGKYAVKIAPSASLQNIYWVAADNSSGYSSLYTRGYFYSTAHPAADTVLFYLSEGSTHQIQVLRQATTGNLGIKYDTNAAVFSSTPMALNGWHKIELSGSLATGATGVYKLWYDGTSIYNVTNATAGVAANLIELQVGSDSNATQTFWADDVVVDTAVPSVTDSSSLTVGDSGHFGGNLSVGGPAYFGGPLVLNDQLFLGTNTQTGIPATADVSLPGTASLYWSQLYNGNNIVWRNSTNNGDIGVNLAIVNGGLVFQMATAGAGAGGTIVSNKTVLSVKPAQVELGQAGASGLTGVLVVNNTGTTNTFVIQGGGAGAAAQTWTLPTAVATAGQCLAASSVASPVVTLGWGACSAGGGGANTSLSNLASVAINTDLQFQAGANRTINVAAAAAGTSGFSLALQGGAGTVSGGTAVAGGNLTFSGGASAGTTAATGAVAAGAGGGFTFTGTNGQDANSATAISAGNGGGLSVTLGNGGTASNAADTPGVGGAFSVAGGNGGTKGTGTSGAGGAIALQGGVGGVHSGVAATSGAGGAVNITGGTGGTGTNVAGIGGNVTLSSGTGGASSAGGNGAGGTLFLQGGNAGAGIGTGQNGGSINIQPGTGGLANGKVVVSPKTGGDVAGLFQVQNAAATTLFSINSLDTNLAKNPGGEISSTFSTDWPAAGYGAGVTVSRDTTTAWNGSAAVKTATTGTANTGVKNVLGAFLASGNYTVSFFMKSSSAVPNANDLVVTYSKDGTTGTELNCGGYNFRSSISLTGWEYISCTLTGVSSTSASASAYLGIYLATGATRNFWVDGLEIGSTRVGNASSSLALDTVLTTPLLVQPTENSSQTFNVMKSNGDSLLAVDSDSGWVMIGNDHTYTGAKAKLRFGDASNVNNPWIGEANGTDSDILQLQGRMGINLSVGNTGVNVLTITSDGTTPTGDVLVKNPNSSGSLTAFQVQKQSSTTPVLDVDTVNGRVGINTAAPGASLDIGSSGTVQGAGLASDCSATNSKLLWSSSSKQFVCGTDRASVTIRKSSDQSVTSSTTLVNDSQLTFAIAANDTYIFHLTIAHTEGVAAAGLHYTIVAPSGATCVISATGVDTAGVGPELYGQACGTVANYGGGNTAGSSFIDGTVITGATSGNVTFQFAQATSNAAATTIKTGSSMVAYKVNGADLAEAYYTSDRTIGPGDVVSLDPAAAAGVNKAAKPYDSHVLGVISTHPGQVLADPQAGTATGRPVLVALSGRIPVKVSAMNGAIRPGDFLTASTAPGVAMKATRPGEVIGKALEGFDGPAGSQSVILMFASQQWADPRDPNGDPLQTDMIQTASASSLNVSGDASVGGDLAVGGNLAVGGALSAKILTVHGLATVAGLNVTGRATVADITVGGHITTQGPAPKAEVTGNAGEGAAIVVDGNDVSGTIAVKTGSKGLAAGNLARLTFGSPYDRPPHVVITPNGAAAAALGSYLGDYSATEFYVGVVTAPKPEETYKFEYFVTQNK